MGGQEYSTVVQSEAGSLQITDFRISSTAFDILIGYKKVKLLRLRGILVQARVLYRGSPIGFQFFITEGGWGGGGAL